MLLNRKRFRAAPATLGTSSRAGGSFRSRRRIRPMFRKLNVPRMISATKRRNFVKNVRSLQLGNSEMKYSSANLVTGVVNHNTLLPLHLWGPSGASCFSVLPSQGTNDGLRIGDRITVSGFMIRAQIDVAWDHRDVQINMYFVPHNTQQGDPSDRTQLFHDVSSSIVLDPMQKKRFPLARKLGTYRLRPTDTLGGEYGGSTGAGGQLSSVKTLHIKKFIPYNKKCYFLADASILPSNWPEYGTILFAPYSRHGNSSTDNIVLSGQVNCTLYFKDI